MIEKIFNRIYSDYLMPSRFEEYEKILLASKRNGYVHLSVRDFCEQLEHDDIPKKVFVHRHDIDTDVKTARKIFEIEKKHGIHASYYFRLSTLDFKLMREIEDFGSEASYHFEEIATYAKCNHIKDPNIVRKSMISIREDFFKNLKMIEKNLEKKITTVASHGDFANRKLKIVNFELLNDDFRKQCGLKCECYDEILMKNFDARISDKPYPVYYSPCSVFDEIANGKKHIYFLSHPRQWNTSFYDNTKENFTRLIESLRW